MQSMMDEAEQSADLLLRLREKSDQIKENLENQEMEKIFRIYLKIKDEVQGSADIEAAEKVREVARNVFEDKALYIPSLEIALYTNDLAYREVASFYPENIKHLDPTDQDLHTVSPQYVKRFVDGKLRIPTLSEWSKTSAKSFSILRFVPNEHGDNSLRGFLEKALKKYGWSINGDIYPIGKYLLSDSRMRMVYPLFIGSEDLLGNALFNRERMQEYCKYRDKLKETDSNLNVVAMNLNEFLYSFLCELVKDFDIKSLGRSFTEGLLLGQRLYDSGVNPSLEAPSSFQSVKVFPEDKSITVYNGETAMKNRIGIVVPGIHK